MPVKSAAPVKKPLTHYLAAPQPFLATQYFQESDLVFSFPDSWIVRKYDDTLAYQSLSGHGLKGVDFIALSPDGRLWLIEVKNYRPRLSARNGREYRAARKPPEVLAASIARKFSDSLRLIRIVDAYLRRHWWRRVQLRWLAWRGRPAPDNQLWFWAEAHRRCDLPGQTTFVLWMETPEQKTGYDDEVLALLREQLPKPAPLYVVEAERDNDLLFGVVPPLE